MQSKERGCVMNSKTKRRIIISVIVFYLILALLTVGADVLNSSLRREYKAQLKTAETIAKKSFPKTELTAKNISGNSWSLEAKLPSAYRMDAHKEVGFQLEGYISCALPLPVVFVEIIAEDFEIVHNGEVYTGEYEYMCHNIEIESIYTPEWSYSRTEASLYDNVSFKYIGEGDGVRTGVIRMRANTSYDGVELKKHGDTKIYYATDGEYIAFSSTGTYSAEKSLEFDTDIFGGGE